MTRARANGEGSIFPYRNGYAAYAWVTKPNGRRARKYVYGKTREIVHEKWLDLLRKAKTGPVATSVSTLGTYLEYWLREVVRPNLMPKTAETYAMHVRLYITPRIGPKRLDKLTVQDVRSWLNRLGEACQCCEQGKDARRAEADRRCCAARPRRCCGSVLSKRSLFDTKNTLRAALNSAVADELITRNVAMGVKVRQPRSRTPKPWSVEEARRFLVSAQESADTFYATFVLILVLGLRRGEVLGLTWDAVDLDNAELSVEHGLQRIERQLMHGPTKTAGSEAKLPLPDICVAALRQHQQRQEAQRGRAGEAWHDTGLVFTGDYGLPFDPRGFNRRFAHACKRAGVRVIRVHDTRHTCGSFLAALDVHPRVAMQILRHSKFDVTMEIYTHVPTEQTKRALKRLGDSLDGTTKINEDGSDAT